MLHTFASWIQENHDVFAIIFSALALAISLATAWFTFGQRGTVKITRPSVIYFGPDGGSKLGRKPKVYLRTLLFSTSQRGRIIEAMYVSLKRNEGRQNFSIWVYGDKHLVRGSGLYVGVSGVTASHHFLTPEDANQFKFSGGAYRLELFAKLLGDTQALRLFSEELVINETAAKALENENCGLYFDWGPDAEKYIPHIDETRPSLFPEELLRAHAIGGTVPIQA